jgi:hypothetical protein
VGVEDHDGATGDSEGGESEVVVILQMEEEVADLLFAEPIWRGVEVVGQLHDGSEIGLLSAFAQTSELEILEHPLT